MLGPCTGAQHHHNNFTLQQQHLACVYWGCTCAETPDVAQPPKAGPNHNYYTVGVEQLQCAWWGSISRQPPHVPVPAETRHCTRPCRICCTSVCDTWSHKLTPGCSTLRLTCCHNTQGWRLQRMCHHSVVLLTICLQVVVLQLPSCCYVHATYTTAIKSHQMPTPAAYGIGQHQPVPHRHGMRTDTCVHRVQAGVCLLRAYACTTNINTSWDDTGYGLWCMPGQHPSCRAHNTCCCCSTGGAHPPSTLLTSMCETNVRPLCNPTQKLAS